MRRARPASRALPGLYTSCGFCIDPDVWPIFIINLDRAQDRMKASEQLMRQAGLDFERVRACDWHELGSADLDACLAPHPPRFAKRPITPPEIACFISHRRIWQKVAAGGWPGAFILEDDFTFTPGFAELLAELSARAPDWDMLKFYSNKKKRLVRGDMLGNGYRVGTPRVIPMSTIAYAVTRPAAAALSASCLPFARPVDLFLKHWWEHGGCIKLVMPAPVGRRHDHLSTSAIQPAKPAGSLLARFVRNTLYQMDFRARTACYDRRRPMHRVWRDDGPAGGADP